MQNSAETREISGKKARKVFLLPVKLAAFAPICRILSPENQKVNILWKILPPKQDILILCNRTSSKIRLCVWHKRDIVSVNLGFNIAKGKLERE